LITANSASISPAFVTEAVELAAQRRNLPWAYDAFSRATRSIIRSLTNRRAFRRMIDTIETPTLLVWGYGDRIVSPLALEWLSGLRPDRTTVTFPDLGHVPMLESPVAVAAEIEKFDEARRTGSMSGGRIA
jgi:pimeloyl-ACP methyl ester carboxylesterase